MQRRILVTALSLLLLLSACGPRTDLAPEEVIRRAVIRSHTVESVSISLSGTIRMTGQVTLSGSVIVQSVVRRSGQAWSADASFNVESTAKTGHTEATGRIVLVAPGDGRLYLRPESMEGMLGEAVRRTLTGSVNGWWVTGEERAFEASSPIPDPAMLALYADAIVVTRDLGIAESDDGREQYHYAVTLRPEAMVNIDGRAEGPPEGFSARGELWIDAEDFSLQRATWDITGLPGETGTSDVKADASFSSYDRSPPISVPGGSSATLPVESIFAIFSRPLHFLPEELP